MIVRIKVTKIVDLSRQAEVDAVIHTGATTIALPEDLIEQLGLMRLAERKVKYADNRVEIKPLYGGLILELRGRNGTFDVQAEVKGSEPLVGQVVLESLDLVVDPKNRTVTPNARSPDMPMLEIL